MIQSLLQASANMPIWSRYHQRDQISMTICHVYKSHCRQCQQHGVYTALFNPETYISMQQRRPYTGNLNSEASGESKNPFLQCGDVIADAQEQDSVDKCCCLGEVRS